MQQDPRSPSRTGQLSGGPQRSSTMNVTAFALRSFGKVFDMNMTATRVMLQTQARAASALGWPDLSDVFNRVDEKARSVFSASAEQLAQTAQMPNEAASELQRQVGRVVETQAATVAETLQQGFEELGAHTSESLKQLCDTAREQAEQAERVGESMSQELRDTLRQGGEQMRDALRQSGDELRSTAREGSQQAQDAAHQSGQQLRDAAQEGGEQMRDAAHQGGDARDAAASASRSGQASADDKARRAKSGSPVTA